MLEYPCTVSSCGHRLPTDMWHWIRKLEGLVSATDSGAGVKDGPTCHVVDQELDRVAYGHQVFDSSLLTFLPFRCLNGASANHLRSSTESPVCFGMFGLYPLNLHVSLANRLPFDGLGHFGDISEGGPHKSRMIGLPSNPLLRLPTSRRPFRP